MGMGQTSGNGTQGGTGSGVAWVGVCSFQATVSTEGVFGRLRGPEEGLSLEGSPGNMLQTPLSTVGYTWCVTHRPTRERKDPPPPTLQSSILWLPKSSYHKQSKFLCMYYVCYGMCGAYLMHVPFVCLEPVEARRGHQSPRN